MLIKREWATPVVIGAFVLSGLTGVALFFGWKTQTTLTIHEWLGLTFALGGLAHITVNFPAFKRHLKQPLARAIVVIYVLLTIAAFLPLAPARPTNNPMSKFLAVMQHAPLNDMAQAFKVEPQVLVERLQTAGFQVTSSAQSVAEVAGPAFEQQVRALGALADSAPPTLTSPGSRTPPN